MDGIPPSIATGLSEALAAQKASQQRKTARFLARRLAMAAPSARGIVESKAVEAAARDTAIAPGMSTSAPRLDVRA